MALGRQCSLFFFNDTATTEIYTLSLHDALPICRALSRDPASFIPQAPDTADPLRHQSRHDGVCHDLGNPADRKSTRLNSSHANISYAVFCLKKKKILHSDHQAVSRPTLTCLYID